MIPKDAIQEDQENTLNEEAEELVESQDEPQAEEPVEDPDVPEEPSDDESEADEADIFSFDLDDDDGEAEEEEVEVEAEAESEEVAEEVEEPAEVETEVSEPDPPPTKKGLDAYKEFHQAAVSEFEKRHGVSYDEFDDVHKDALADIKHEVKQHQSVQAKIDRAFQQVQAAIKDGGEGFQAKVNEHWKNLTVREAERIIEAEQRGDVSLTLAEIAKVKSAGKVKVQAAAKAKQLTSQKPAPQKSTPPKTIGSGSGARTPTRTARDSIGPDELFGL